jgi:hypothetical protein
MPGAMRNSFQRRLIVAQIVAAFEKKAAGVVAPAEFWV